MVRDEYVKARKEGLRQVQRAVAAGRFPYPPALDDILHGQGTRGEVSVGVREIPLRLVSGTKTRSRQDAFSCGFMPLLDPSSEFADKWCRLLEAQYEEGIHDAIVAYEYLQHFYVQEGNKRVSVLRHAGAPSIAASVVRVLPMPQDSLEYRVYQEFLRFYAVAPVYGIEFSREGGYARLARLMGHDLTSPWGEEAVICLRSGFDEFVCALESCGGGSVGICPGDAFLAYLDIYGAGDMGDVHGHAMAERVSHIWGELTVSGGGDKIAYLEEPSPKPAVAVPGIRDLYAAVVSPHPFRVAFLYDKDPATDGWDAQHERGRLELEGRLPNQVETLHFCDCSTPGAFARALDAALADDDDLIVTTSGTQAELALRSALAHPGRDYINCSVSMSHEALRMYYPRLFEAKFLLGALAACLTTNHCIGYVADTPVFSSTAEINAFAIGVSMIDPGARVYLKWLSAAPYEWKRELGEDGVDVVEFRDYPEPTLPDEPWGLCVPASGSAAWADEVVRMAQPVFAWGRFYELIVQSIRSDSWRRDPARLKERALNYWWGMREGVVDVRLGEKVGTDQRRLIEVLRQSLLSGGVHPFTGRLVSQDGLVQPEGSPRLSGENIVRMSWLNHNVVGRLPEPGEIAQDRVGEVAVSGLIPVDPQVQKP